MLDREGRPADGLVASRIIERGGFRIGFFGLVTPETDILSSPGEDIAFAPILETARNEAAALQAEGAEVIVALTHLDLIDEWELADNVRGIHLILGGHDHLPIAFRRGGTAILQAGHDAHYLGIVDLHLEWVERRGKKRLSVLPEWRLVTTAGVVPDPGVQALVDERNAMLDEALNVVIGSTAVELDTRRSSVRTRESNFGNLVAEAMRRGVGAEVGLTNGGGIRGDRTYPAGTRLTRKDLLTELPFGNTVVLMELSGADLLAALENGVSRVEDRAGRFPQIAGLRLVYDPGAPAGSRVVEVEVGGTPLDPGRTYTVATNDYMAGGGDGYARARERPPVDRRGQRDPDGHDGHGLRRGDRRGRARGGRPDPHPLTPRGRTVTGAPRVRGGDDGPSPRRRPGAPMAGRSGGGERGVVEVGPGEDRLDPAEALDPGLLIDEGAPVRRIGVHDPMQPRRRGGAGSRPSRGVRRGRAPRWGRR